jgi:hypothetical protein
VGGGLKGQGGEMGNETDVEEGIRTRLTGLLGNSYLWIGDNDVMLVVPSENDPKNAVLRALTEANCRVASKAMKLGLTRNQIAEQWRKADSGRCSILSDMAECLESYNKTVMER